MTVQPTPESRRVGIAVAILVLAITAPVMHPRGGEQQASRYALTAAIWDHQTVVLDRYVNVLGRDHAVRDGVVYSDKAPGQPFLAVPFYGLYRLVGGQPAEVPSQGPDWGLWWVTLWTAAIPGAILAYLMFTWARQHAPPTAVWATLSVSLGTLLAVYSTLLFSHVLAACLLFGMFLLTRRGPATAKRLALAGVLGGAAVATEFPVALVVGVLTIAAFTAHRSRAWALIAGGIPMAALVLLYNERVTGNALTFPYQWTGFSGQLSGARDLTGVFGGLSADRLLEVLFAQRGLLIESPIVWLAILGFALLWRRSRAEALISLAAVLSLLAVQTLWSTSFAGGAGPRYAAASIPFLVAPIALAWERWSRPASIAAILSVATMTLAALTNPQIPSEVDAGLAYWSLLALNGRFAPNMFTEMAEAGGFLYGALVVGALVWLAAAIGRWAPGGAAGAKSTNSDFETESIGP